MHPQLPRQQRIDNYVQALVHLLVGFRAHICIQQLSSVLERILRFTAMPCVLLYPRHISNVHDAHQSSVRSSPRRSAPALPAQRLR